MASAAITWSWRNAVHGILLAAPAALVSALVDPAVGMPLAIGVLPAAALGVQSARRDRLMVVAVGAVAGVSIFLGSLVAAHPVIAVVTVFVLCVAVALFAAGPARRLGTLAMALGLPLFGAGRGVGGAAVSRAHEPARALGVVDPVDRRTRRGTCAGAARPAVRRTAT